MCDLGARDLAAAYRRMALDLVASGVGDPIFPHKLGIARMAALLGDTSEAAEYFGDVRDQLGEYDYVHGVIE